MATTQIKNGFNGGSDDQLLVNPDGSINVNTSGGGGTSNINIVEVGGNPVTTTVPVSGTVTTLAGTPTPLTIHQAALTVGTSAVRLTVSGSAPAATRVVLAATPDSTSTAKFYIGSNTVTNSGAARGIQIIAGQSFIANDDAGDYWIVSDTTGQTVEIMEQY